MKIIIADKRESFQEEYLQKLEEKGDLFFIQTPEEWNNPEILFSEDEKVLALDPGICDWKLPNELIDQIPNLKSVCLPTTGFGWVDDSYLESKNVSLTNVPHYSTEAVAEHCIFLMLALSKKFVEVVNDNWTLDYSSHIGMNVNGKRMGIIGLGSIGSRVAELGSGFGMNVSYWSPNTRNESYEYLELEELLKCSDYIFVTIAHNSNTENLLNEDLLSLMKKDANIINITGNEVWDFDYVVNMVKEEKLFGVALDGEKESVQNYGCNVLVTPSMAWYTEESLDECYRIWVENILSVLDGKPINLVN
jgi:lactate dehydrogenase-like 2-hydroxyacid dehydrogenase